MSIDVGQWRAAIGEFSNISISRLCGDNHNYISKHVLQLRFLPLILLTGLLVIFSLPLVVLGYSLIANSPFLKHFSIHFELVDYPLTCIKNEFLVFQVSLLFMFRVSWHYTNNLLLYVYSDLGL